MQDHLNKEMNGSKKVIISNTNEKVHVINSYTNKMIKQ
jgi:hypothetical protein